MISFFAEETPISLKYLTHLSLAKERIEARQNKSGQAKAKAEESWWRFAGFCKAEFARQTPRLRQAMTVGRRRCC